MEKVVCVPLVFFMKIHVSRIVQLAIFQLIELASHVNIHAEPVKVQEISVYPVLMDLLLIKKLRDALEQTDAHMDKLNMEQQDVIGLALINLYTTKIAVFIHALLDMIQMDMEGV